MIAEKTVLSRLWPFLALAILIVFVAAVRIRLMQIPLERDEGEFAYMGQLMLQGIPPYSMAYNMKLPGIYAAYALLMAIFGQTIAGIHIGLLAVNAIAIVLLYFLTRRLFSPLAGVVASASYALLSLSPTVLGTSAHATHFVVPLVLGGLILLLRALDSGNHRTLFSSGLLFGVAFLMKQPAVFFIVFASSYILWSGFSPRPDRKKSRVKATALFGTAVFIPFIVSCMILYAAGCFANFWFWTFSYASRYVSEIPLIEAAGKLAIQAPLAMESWEWVWIIAGTGLSATFWNRTAQSGRVFLVGLALASFLSVCPGFHFRSHYFITLLPSIAMLAGIGVAAGTHALAGKGIVRAAKIIPILIMAAALLYPVIRHREFLFEANPHRASRILYGLSPFPESIEVAAYLNKNSNCEDRIFVFGSEPQICFYADRKSATGYIYVYGLMEIHDYVARMRSELIREIERANPRFAVIVNVKNSWTPGADSDKTIFRWAEGYFKSGYRMVGLVDMMPDGSYRSYWDEKAANRKPESGTNLYIVERVRQ